ncbi:MAG: HAMP domain-containing histidine kinase [Clostridia bacterium]|nr:HAMP domain-containing histidine kinase [Clostridia bacterium]
MIRRLRLKLALMLTLIVSLMLGIVFGVVITSTQRRMEHESRLTLQRMASMPFAKPPVRPWEPPEEVRLPMFVLRELENGEIHAIGGELYDLSDQAFLRTLLDEVRAQGNAVGTLAQYDLRYHRDQGERVFFVDISSERSAVRHLARNCLLIGLLALLLFWPVSLALAAWAVRPVERTFAEQRRFVADASHDLKTPLAVVITNAELLTAEDGSETRRLRCAAGILAAARQMRRLTEGLLELARIDDGALHANFAPVRWSETVLTALLPYEPILFERGLALTSRIEENLIVTGSEVHLAALVEELLGNAAKYGRERVELTLTRQGRSCLLTVTSGGDAIAPEELEQIFRRFYRLDAARSDAAGHGLGLAIARAAAEAHGGSLWAESGAFGNRFLLRLPLARSGRRVSGR